MPRAGPGWLLSLGFGSEFSPDATVHSGRVGCIPDLGWEQCWGGCEGRHKAGTYRELMGLAGRGLAGHVRLGTRSNIDTRSGRQ